MAKGHTEDAQLIDDDNQDLETVTAEETEKADTDVDKSNTGSLGSTESKRQFTGGAPKPIESAPDNSQTVGGVKIEWAPNSFAEDILKTKTKESTAKPVDTPTAGGDEEEPSEEEKRAYMAGEMDKAQEPMTIEELMEVAELVIDLLDALNSTAVGAFAGEKADKFQLPASQRKRLAGFLARVFFKYQVRTIFKFPGMVFQVIAIK